VQKGILPIDGFKFKNNNNNEGGVESSRYFPERGNRRFMIKTMDAAVDRYVE